MTHPKQQRGILLIEVLVALLLFVIGILVLIKVMSISQSAQADAQSRSEAASFASAIVQKMRVTADHTNATTFKTSLEGFQHLTTTDSSCAFSGTASANALVVAWVADIRTGAAHLPGSTAVMQQVLVDTTATGFNKVTVTICWKGSSDIQPRRHTYSAYVNANFN